MTGAHFLALPGCERVRPTLGLTITDRPARKLIIRIGSVVDSRRLVGVAVYVTHVGERPFCALIRVGIAEG